ncbi:MAG TPA: single-stranded DNA-binding protein [Candidatus Kapabacteria bacterium]|nr:single-stranded DNA-binding protein [Candidatus Kapabacteria bacterium]
MARGLNKVMLIGHIQPNDPELRYTQNGQPVCTFKVVTDESYRDRDGNTVERAEWHNIVVWGKPGEIIAQYMKKGRQIYLEGRIQSRKYEDKEGQTRYITEINVSDFAFLDGGRGGDGESGGGGGSRSNQASSPSPAPQNATASSSGDSGLDDDLPF